MMVMFWAGVVWLVYVYIGYPFAIWLIGFVRRFRPAIAEDFFPTVSILISARNEEKDIRWKVRETLDWDYPHAKLRVLVASDASEDRTDEILKSIDDPRFTYIRIEPRSGKNAALNRLALLTQADLLFFTDANSHIDSTCLRRMVRYFADPRVGCVTGFEESVPESETTVIGAGGNTYLEYEPFLNGLESRMGSVLVCDGSIFCIRRSLFVPLRPELANDLELPIHIGHAGFRLLYEPTARSREHSTCSPREEFARRRRICGQGFLGMWELRKSIDGIRLWQFLSRKAMRWLTIVPLLMVFTASAFLSARSIFAAALGLEVSFLALATLGWTFALIGRNGGRLLSLPFYFMLSTIGAMTGVIETCLGRRFHFWQSPSLTRGQKESPSYEFE